LGSSKGYRTANTANAAVFCLAYEPGFEVDVLVSSFHFQLYQLVEGHVVNTIHWARFNGNFDRFIVVTPLIKDTCPTMLLIHEKSRLSNHSTTEAERADKNEDVSEKASLLFESHRILLATGNTQMQSYFVHPINSSKAKQSKAKKEQRIDSR